MYTTTQERLVIPQLVIPFKLVNPDDVMAALPTQINEGTYRLKTPYDMHIDSGRSRLIKTGIKLCLPEYVDLSPCLGIPVNTETTVFPRATLHVHVVSIFDTLVDHGIEVIGPAALTAGEVNDKELVIFIKNIGKKMYMSKKGDAIAEMYFTCSPYSVMRLIQ